MPAGCCRSIQRRHSTSYEEPAHLPSALRHRWSAGPKCTVAKHTSAARRARTPRRETRTSLKPVEIRRVRDHLRAMTWPAPTMTSVERSRDEPVFGWVMCRRVTPSMAAEMASWCSTCSSRCNRPPPRRRLRRGSGSAPAKVHSTVLPERPVIKPKGARSRLGSGKLAI